MSGAVSKAVNFAGEHPVMTALGVFAIGAVVLVVLRGSGGGGEGGSSMSAFYAASAASSSAGNQLAAVQAQVNGATAIAKIAADRDVALLSATGATQKELAELAGKYNAQMATVKSQTDLVLADYSREVALAQEKTRIEAQNKAYWQGVGQNQIQGASLAYLLQAINSGNPTSAAAARDVMLAQIKGGSQYYAAR